jgi:hypothetical protein
MTPNHRWPLASILLVAVMLGTSGAGATFAQTEVTEATACRAEVEPNDSLAQAVTIAAERCVSGTLVQDGDRDIFIWQVDADAAASGWSMSLQGTPGAATARVVRIDTVEGADEAELGAEVGHVTSDLVSEPRADVQVEAGSYAIVIEPTDPVAAPTAEDLDYQLQLSPAVASDGEPVVVADEATARIVVGATGDAPVLGQGVAVELLLDTSGSMLERLGKSTKLEAAEKSLITLVGRLPAGVPLALRTFKDEPRSCATVLRAPAEPLRPKAMKRTIRELPVRKGTRTPIAKALSKVPQDLDGVDGHRVVVLVTDGKEDCGGDPAAAIAALADAGYTSAVQIIGYALPDDAAARTALAGWAALGGGRYFEAPDRAGLDEALASALTAPYLVFDAGDELVAQGLVGDEGVDLDAGTYRVEILADPAWSEVVELEAGAVVHVPEDAEDPARA